MPRINVKPMSSSEYDKQKQTFRDETFKTKNMADMSNTNAMNSTNSMSSLRSSWEEFKNETSLHGIQHVDFRRKIRGIFWALALAAMVGMLLKILINLHTAYYSYPMITNVNVEMPEELSFPSMTVCNLSPFNKSRLNPDNALNSYFLKLSNLGVFLPPINFSDPANANLTEEIRTFYAQNYGFEFHMFFVCVFKSAIVNCTDYFKPRMTEWGLCYSFNDNRQVPAITTEHTGSVTALTLYMHIDQLNYVYGENLGAGIKIVLHERDEEPNVRNSGFLASPGFATYASLQMIKYKYLAPPFKAFGDKYCTNTKSPDFKNPLRYYSTYSYSACMKECKQIYVFQRCNCSSVFDKGNSTFCSHEDFMECYKPVSDIFDVDVNGQKNCSCPLPCETTEYVAQVSAAYFPSDINSAVMQTFGYDDLRQNYLEVRVFYDSLKYTTIEQIPKYAIGEIAATIGGQMGIFIGASFLTIAEVAEFVIFAVFSFVRSKLFKRQKHQHQ